jgi:hypothetical protein
VLRSVDALMQSVVRERGVIVFHAPARALETLRFAPGYERDQRAYGTSALCYLFQARRARGIQRVARADASFPSRAVKPE